MCVCVCLYVFIYSHTQTDCFLRSHLSSVARHTGCFKLGLKPAQFYVRPTTIHISHQSINVSSGNYKLLCSSFFLFTFCLT